MGRIAEAALARLGDAPATLDDLAADLARAGVTRARNPAAAVRRALRADPRVVVLGDGRLASIAKALEGVVLTSLVSVNEHCAGPSTPMATWRRSRRSARRARCCRVDIRPGDLRPGAVGRAAAGRIEAAPAPSHLERADAEPALVAAVRGRLAHVGSAAPEARRIRLADALCDVTAADPAAFRRPGRPLSDVLRDAGFEVHLGWVAPVGTRWGALTELEIDALERGVADHLAADRPVEAAELQDRVVSLLRRHLPERVPEARRRLARVLARAGRARDGLSVLTGAFGFGDPEDRYEACLLAIRLGDVVAGAPLGRRGARLRATRPSRPRWRRVWTIWRAIWMRRRPTARSRSGCPQPLDRVPAASRLATRLVAPHRSYLVGALVEQTFADLDEAECADADRRAASSRGRGP